MQRQGPLTCRRSLSPVQMSVGMPGTRLFTRSYTKTFSSQLAKQHETQQLKGYSRQRVVDMPLIFHPRAGQMGSCFVIAGDLVLGLCKRCVG